MKVLCLRDVYAALARNSSLSAAYFFLSKMDTSRSAAISAPLPRTSGGERHRRVRVRVRTESGPIVGSSGFRMNKHWLNRDSGSPGALRPPPSPTRPMHHFTVVPLRNSWLHFRLLRLAHRAAGALTLFEGRRTFLRSWLRSASWIDLNLSPVRDGSFTSFFSLLSPSPLSLPPSHSLSFPPSVRSFEEARWCN